MKRTDSWLYRRFVNSKFMILLVDLLLALLVIFVFTKIAWVFQPVVDFLGIIAPPFIFAGILFYLTVPIINRLEKAGLHRGLAIGLLFIVLISLLVWGLLRFIPAVSNQITSIVDSAPQIFTEIGKWLDDLNDKQNILSQHDLNEIANEVQTFFTGKQGAFVTGTISQLQNLIGIVGNVVVTISTAPIILFFMLKDGDKFTPMILQIVPTKLRRSVKQMLHEMNEKVGSYVQGQITVALCVAVMFMIGYSVIGLRYGLIFGLLACPLNLIPYFGSALAMIPPLIMGALTSPRMILAVFVVFFIEWLIETQLISPLVMGSKLELHPITIVVVLLTAGNLFGLVGVILGIPGFAVLKIVVTRFFSWYQQVSGLYESDHPTDEVDQKGVPHE